MAVKNTSGPVDTKVSRNAEAIGWTVSGLKRVKKRQFDLKNK